MLTIRRAAMVLIWPALAWMGAACDRPDPTEPELPGVELSSGGSGTLWVNDDDPNGGLYVPPGNGCNNPGYPTIQSAVTAATPGAHINVCPGIYIEQVTIPVGKDRLRLQSVHRWEAVIKAPPVMNDPKAIVRVNGAHDVTILAFTITGPGGFACNSLRYGVRVDDYGSANILGNHITEIRDNPFGGCQNGVAVQVGRRFQPGPGDLTPPDITVGTAKIMGNVIDRYQKNGPTVSNAGSYAEIAHNRILGSGPTAVIAQNGIQASSEATAEIRHNFVAQNLYIPQTVVSTGILLFESGKVLTEHNTATSNDVSIYLFDAGAGSETIHNRARASTFDGIAVQEGPGSEVAYNKTEENGGPGIGVYDARNNALDNNKVEDNDDSGILLDNADNNMVGNNQVRENGTPGFDLTDGIRAEAGSVQNIIQKNHLRDNVTHDCHDVVPDANVWIDNHGETSVPAGICDRENDDAAFATTTAYGWDPDYPWSAAFDIPADYDWAAAYATIDTEGLLQLLPGAPAIGIHRVPVSPQP